MMRKDKNKSTAVSSPVDNNKPKAKAFVNWAIPLKDGTEFKSDKGFPIFQNPDYPNPKEDKLIALAEKHGGTVVVTMIATIRLNTGASEDINLDDIEVIVD